MREFVENALDAAESIGALPDIFVTMYVLIVFPYLLSLLTLLSFGNLTLHSEEISQQRFNTLFGVESVERKNASLYRDSDVPKDKKAREFLSKCIHLPIFN